MACAVWSPVAMAATEAEKLAAIQAGLAYLSNTQQADGSWSASGYEQAAAGAAAFSFLSQQGRWGGNAVSHQAAVERAIAYVLSTANLVEVSTRADGVNICPGGNGSCKGVYWSSGAESTYTTGSVAPAIAVYGVTRGANVVATASGPLTGMTWGQIAQGITNALAASQVPAGGGSVGGGWRDFLAGDRDSAVSTTQWAVMAFLYDETLGATTPQVVKDDLKGWLNKVQAASGAACAQPGSQPCTHADTGGWLLAAKFSGYELPEARLQAALSFLNTYWQATANNVWHGNFGHPYAMWAVYRGLETTIGLDDATQIRNLLTDCGGRPSGSGPCTWSEDYNQWLVSTQAADGRWGGYSPWDGPITVAFYINILGATHIPTGTYKCPVGQSFWHSTPGAWPLASLSLGGQTYAKQELLAILKASLGSGMSADASMTLAGELIAAKLNLARGSDSTPVAATIAEADRLLSGFTGRLPYRIPPSSTLGQSIADAAKVLGGYNGGSLTRSCTPVDALIGSNALDHANPQSLSVTSLGAAAQTSAADPSASAQSSQSASKSKKPRPYNRKGVTALAVNGDGSVLASGSTDYEIRTWNASTGKQNKDLSGSRGLPTGLAFSPGGNLNSASRDSLVRVWDAVSGSELSRFAGHEHAIRAVAASPDGRFLGSAGEESRIMLWDRTSRKLSKILFGATDFVNTLSFSPNSRLFAIGGEDARVVCFDVAAGASVYTLLGHSGPIDAVAFSPDGTVLASGGQDTVIRLWDAVKGQQRQALTGHSAPIRAIAFSPDGRLIASGGEDTRIILWNAGNGTIDKILSGAKGFINVLAFGPNGDLNSADEAGDITVWNINTGAKTLTIKVPPAK
jgi:WD40 repeat protein